MNKKFDSDSFSHVLVSSMKEHRTMPLSQLLSKFESMNEEASALIGDHGKDTLCGSIDIDSVDSSFLVDALKELSDSKLEDVPPTIEAVPGELEDLIEEHGAEALCGDFDLS